MTKEVSELEVEEISREELFEMQKDYIFHGSPKLFDTCKPHQAVCGTKKPENNQFAIYGSSDLRFSLLFSFEKSPCENWSFHTSSSVEGVIGVLANGTFIDEKASGYIYCFDKTAFESTNEGGTQFVCKNELAPQKIYKVYYKDYKDLFVSEGERAYENISSGRGELGR